MADRKFVDAMLTAHNEYRKAHGVPSLKINKDLNKMAQNWAEQLAKTNRFEHSKDRIYKSAPVGENLAMKWTSNNEDYRGDEATKQWYDEISQYSYRTASGPGTGHFTQVVWLDSRELGVGRAQTRDGKWIACANYFPAGNYVGRYAENVLPPGSKPVKHAPPPKAASAKQPTVTTTTYSSSSTPKAKSGFMDWIKKGPKSWFSKSSSSSTPKEVPIVQAREFNPNGGYVHVQSSSRPTFNTTIVTERNTKPSSSHSSTVSTREPFYNTPTMTSQPMMTSQARGYSKTVVTQTVIGPDGKKTVTTREEVKDITTPGFGKSRNFNWK